MHCRGAPSIHEWPHDYESSASRLDSLWKNCSQRQDQAHYPTTARAVGRLNHATFQLSLLIVTRINGAAAAKHTSQPLERPFPASSLSSFNSDQILGSYNPRTLRHMFPADRSCTTSAQSGAPIPESAPNRCQIDRLPNAHWESPMTRID